MGEDPRTARQRRGRLGRRKRGRCLTRPTDEDRCRALDDLGRFSVVCVGVDGHKGRRPKVRRCTQGQSARQGWTHDRCAPTSRRRSTREATAGRRPIGPPRADGTRRRTTTTTTCSSGERPQMRLEPGRRHGRRRPRARAPAPAGPARTCTEPGRRVSPTGSVSSAAKASRVGLARLTLR